MQGSFSVWTDSKKDRLRELRLKPMQRHIFLYQKAMLFCKKAAKEVHNKDTYHFKRYLKVSYVSIIVFISMHCTDCQNSRKHQQMHYVVRFF